MKNRKKKKNIYIKMKMIEKIKKMKKFKLQIKY